MQGLNDPAPSFPAVVFGPVAVQVSADQSVDCANCIGNGIDVWGRMSFRICAPEGPKPLVAKN